MEDLKQQYLDEMKCLSNFEYRDEIKIVELTENFNVTPSLSIEEPDNSLSMGDEHLDTIPTTKSDEFIKSSVENLIPISLLYPLEGIPEHMCDVPFYDNSSPLDVSKDQYEDFFDSNDEFSSIDDDSFSIDNIDYVEASPPDSELVSSEVMDCYPEEYDCFLFKVEPNSGDFTMDVVEDISPTKKPQVHNALPTHPTLQLNLKFQPSSESLFTYVVWIFLPLLVYSVAPQYLISLRNEDTIFDPDILNYHSF
uniref:Uncharacterized protein n=1 Tax=Tanacetum cinerariifolium TaxID=118510 RepID=A0A699IJE7_TANCI|nr:hypothetical protein [Tanacetum cinerariifolium]